MLLGVDRLDYTKGIDAAAARVRRAARATATLDAATRVFVQIAVPSRASDVEEYRGCATRSSGSSGAINGEFGEHRHAPPCTTCTAAFPPEELVALYRAADVMLVTPLARRHEPRRQGVRRLPHRRRRRARPQRVRRRGRRAAGGLLVNPYDVDGIKDSILEAYHAEPSVTSTRRMRAMRRTIKSADIEAWARSFLEAMDEVRPAHGKQLLPADKT